MRFVCASRPFFFISHDNARNGENVTVDEQSIRSERKAKRERRPDDVKRLPACTYRFETRSETGKINIKKKKRSFRNPVHERREPKTVVERTGGGETRAFLAGTRRSLVSALPPSAAAPVSVPARTSCRCEWPPAAVSDSPARRDTRNLITRVDGRPFVKHGARRVRWCIRAREDARTLIANKVYVSRRRKKKKNGKNKKKNGGKPESTNKRVRN